MNPRPDLALCEPILQGIATRAANDVDVVNVTATLGLPREFHVGVSQQAIVCRGMLGTLSIPEIQMAQLDAKDCSLDFVPCAS